MQLTAINDNGTHTVTKTLQITNDPSTIPTAEFQTTGFLFENMGIPFINQSQQATGYLWDFGDGNTSTEANPIHEYDSIGIFQVNLTAQNGANSHTTTLALHIRDNLENLAGDYLVNGIKYEWGDWTSNPYPVGLCTLNVSVVNDTTLKILGWEVLRQPDNIGNTQYFSFADKQNYIHTSSHTGAYFTYYLAADSMKCSIHLGHLGSGAQWYYKGKKL